MELSHRTTILLTKELHLRLTALARREGVSLGELVRRACRIQYGLLDPEERIEAVRELASLALPVGEPSELKQESVPAPEDLLP